MSTIYWLASYPKSGNTWVRILLTNYLRDGEMPADINWLGTHSIASARQIFDDHVGIESSDLTPEEIERYRPFVYDDLASQTDEPLFIKVHDAFTYTEHGYPLISKASTAGVIYLIRNPLDVSVSFAHHSAAPVERMVKKMGDPDFSFVANPHQLHNQLRQKLLSWSGHVTSWVDEPGLRTLVIRYEDLKADTAAAFTELIRFAGLEEDPERIAKAVAFSKFEEVQRQEQEKGFGEKMSQSKSFFRKGLVGSWREELTAELIGKLINDHREVMERFGYLNSDGDIIY